MQARSLMRKQSFSLLHHQITPCPLSSVDAAGIGTYNENGVDSKLASKFDSSGAGDIGTFSKKSWKARFSSRRCASTVSHHCGFDQAEAFADLHPESTRAQLLGERFEELKDLPNLERTMTATSLRSLFGPKGPNSSLKRRKISLDADCANLEANLAMVNLDGDIQNNHEKNGVMPRKRHCGRRFKRLFGRGRHDDTCQATHAMLEPHSQPPISASSNSTNTYDGKMVFELGPDIEAALHSGSTKGFADQPGRKRDYLRQTLRFSKQRTRPYPRLQNYQYHGEPVFQEVFNAKPPAYNSSSASPLKEAATAETQHELYNQYCKRSLLDHGSCVDVEPGMDGDADNGSTLYDNSQAGLSGTSDKPFEIWQVYPGETNKPVIFTKQAQPAAIPVAKKVQKVKKPAEPNHGRENGSKETIKAPCDVLAYSNINTCGARAEKTHIVSQFIPSPDPSVPSSPNLYASNSLGEKEKEVLSPPLIYSAPQEASSAPELVLPLPAANITLSNTLGRAGMGIELGTMRSSKYHGSLRAAVPTGGTVKELAPWKQPGHYTTGTESENMYRNLRPPMKVNDHWI